MQKKEKLKINHAEHGPGVVVCKNDIHRYFVVWENSPLGIICGWYLLEGNK